VEVTPGANDATTPDSQPSGVVPHPAPVGVVWDLGNVLIEWDPYAAVAAGVGPEEARRFLAADDFDFGAWNHGPDSGLTWAEAEEQVLRDHPHWVEHALAYRANFAASLRGPVAGTVDLLRQLHAAGVPMWGLTNWSHELYPHAPATFSFLGLLDDVVVSGTEGVAKPDARIFEVVRDRTGRDLAELVLVDDKPENVEAAVAAGMDGIVFTGADSLRAALRGRGLPV
jgi:2-haloacid dehalogenase